MALVKLWGVWKDQGWSYYRDTEGPGLESESPNFSKEEHARLSVYLSRQAAERQVRKYGLNPASSYREAKKGPDGLFLRSKKYGLSSSLSSWKSS